MQRRLHEHGHTKAKPGTVAGLHAQAAGLGAIELYHAWPCRAVAGAAGRCDLAGGALMAADLLQTALDGLERAIHCLNQYALESDDAALSIVEAADLLDAARALLGGGE